MFDQACKLQYGEQPGVFERKKDVHECVSPRGSGGGEGGARPPCFREERGN